MVVKEDDHPLEYVVAELHADKEVVLVVEEEDGLALEYVVFQTRPPAAAFVFPRSIVNGKIF
eukprot:SAG31_NODE_4633_length_3083_cov_5.088807_2_plen_62_part_00